jgi:hypothetical protein
LVTGELGHHLALEHGDGMDGCLFGQSLGHSPGVNGLQHFGLPHLLRVALLSFSFCLATCRWAAHFFDSATRASDVISFLPLERTVGAGVVVVDWTEGSAT